MRRFRVLNRGALVVLVGSLGCVASPNAELEPVPSFAPEVPAPAVAEPEAPVLATVAPTAEDLRVELGRAAFQTTCSACHSLEPPHRQAPPFSHIARRIKREFSDWNAFRDHVVRFVTSPDGERSVMPAHAIERFGLMPALPLPENRLEDVAAYLWTLAEDGHARMGGGGRHGHRGGNR